MAISGTPTEKTAVVSPTSNRNVFMGICRLMRLHTLESWLMVYPAGKNDSITLSNGLRLTRNIQFGRLAFLLGSTTDLSPCLNLVGSCLASMSVVLLPTMRFAPSSKSTTYALGFLSQS